MKTFNCLLIFFVLINIIFSIPPIWNFKKSSIDLLSTTKEKIIYSNSKNNNKIKVELKKQFTKDNSEIKYTNYIKVNNGNDLETNWEDIESIYYINDLDKYFICPKGKNYLNEYINNDFRPIIPNDFDKNNNNWELLCYHQFNEKNWMFQTFLNLEKKTNFFGLDLSNYNEKNWKNRDLRNGVFDFLWTTENMGNLREHNMFALVLNNFIIYFQHLIVTIDYDNTKDIYINYEDNVDNSKAFIDYKSKYMYAYFNHDTNKFYWVTCNTTKEYHSGYSINGIDITSSNAKIPMVKNLTSPFEFLTEVKINKMEMIRNSKFVYYEITINETNNEIYHGIIDIENNKIIFNTNETLIKFQPLTHNSILAITSESAYEICAIKEEGNCVDECSKGQLILDAEKGNFCSEKSVECENYRLIPHDVCIKSCNEYIYTSVGKKCGLCKDLSSSHYKIINKNGCVDSKPENTYYINENMKIIDYCMSNCKNCSNSEECIECDKGFILKNKKCVKQQCFKNCLECNELSTNETDQKCTKCKQDYVFFNNNCLNECPNGTIKNGTICQLETEVIPYMTYIFIILILIILILISLCICKSKLSSKKSDTFIMNDINKELQESNNMFTD